MPVTNDQCHAYRQDIAKAVILEVEEAVILITLRYHFTNGSDSQPRLCMGAFVLRGASSRAPRGEDMTKLEAVRRTE